MNAGLKVDLATAVYTCTCDKQRLSLDAGTCKRPLKGIQHPRVLDGHSRFLPDGWKGIRVSTKFCIFGERGTVVLQFGIELQEWGKEINYCT